MTVGELIKELAKYDSDLLVYVWESYDAGCMTTDFIVTKNNDNNCIDLE